uniref:Uncharacterized protein n=1 Tax=Timema genevievae TaxID=629358 RepID=A0A7R9K3G8_TIMGE|nr:unnamed protein product [Timema genevievae]
MAETCKEAGQIQQGARDTKAEAEELRDEASALAGRVAVTGNKVKELEEKAAGDKDLTTQAKDKVGQAKSDADEATKQVEKALQEVQEIMKELNDLPNTDNEEALNQLERRLNAAEDELRQANLDQRLQSLREARNLQTQSMKNYDEELKYLRQEVENIEDINESLPEGCWKRMAALELVQSNFAPRLCHRQRYNRSVATLFLYAPEIFWSSRTQKGCQPLVSGFTLALEWTADDKEIEVRFQLGVLREGELSMENVERYVNSADIAVHPWNIGLYKEVLEYLSKYGQEATRAFYSKMNIEAFIRIMSMCRCKYAYGREERFASADGAKGREFSRYSATQNESMYYLRNYEVVLYGLIGASSLTKFINRGERKNMGILRRDGHIVQEGAIVGLVGPNLRYPGKGDMAVL